MSTLAAFIIGLLVGWVIEWIIDWVYWRRKRPTAQPEDLEKCRVRVKDLEQEIASYKNQLATLQEERLEAERLQADRLKADVSRSVPVPTAQEVERPAAMDTRAVEQVTAPGHLETIQGLTAEMVRRLRETGIDTLAKLSALVPQKLKEILGDLISQPGSEVEIIKQARLASGMIQQVDDLVVINGIGPVIARTLNQAGIFTFAELAALTAADLREILGKQIQRLANEEHILSEARLLAEQKNRGG